MKAAVVYYSQFGNTKKLAQSIAKGIEKENGQCDCLRFQEVSYESLADYDLIGFGTPTWGSCPVLNVYYFLDGLPENFTGKHTFYFCSHGMTPGRVVLRATAPMYKRGMKVLGWNDWYGTACCAGHLKPWFTDRHPDDIDLAEAESFGGAMARHSAILASGDESIIPEPMTNEICDYIYGPGHPFLFGEDMPEPEMPKDLPEGMADRKPPEAYPPLKYPTTMAFSMALEGIKGQDLNAFAPPAYIDADKCIGCNRCVEACFCDNIDGSTTPPTIINPYCEHCYFCEGVCPTGAMVFQFRPAPKSKEEALEGLGSYGKILNDAESKGRFRRLVPDEEIGWTTPWEVATTHPRHKEIP
ncbi:MAG: flavodoxin domain-containing protein [Oscillospiraceae bacterium]|nr:flavodoxin domain-containing protein [Oscillospiraceae bacterium]